MKNELEREEAERLLPLLRSIGREIRSRAIEAARIQHLIESLRPGCPVHRLEIRELQSQLSAQVREKRRAEKELQRLGCRADANKILIPAPSGEHVLQGFCEATQFVPVGAGHYQRGPRSEVDG